MNILFVTCWYPHSGFPHRGIFVNEHARAVARLDSEVKVFHIWVEHSSSIWEIEKRRRVEEGVESFSVIIHSRFQRYIYGNTPLMRFLGLRYYKKIVHPVFVPDIIQGNVIYQAGIIAQRLAGYLSRPYVIAEHWSNLDWYFGNRVLSYRAKKAYRSAEMLLPVSGFLAKEIQKHIGEYKEMEPVPNVVDTGQFYFEAQGGESSKIELLMVMNYQNSKKRPELFLKALGALPDDLQQKFRVTMIGRGNGTVEKETYWRKLGIKTEVTFLGELEKKDVAQKMREADFLMHPSEMETFGVVIAEALCCGLPCIASRMGALPERIDRESGLLLDNSTAEWQRMLQDLADNRYNFDRKSIARRYANRFTYETVGEQLTAVYKAVLSRR